jgi:sugar phosphate isomerase/epimerase
MRLGGFFSAQDITELNSICPQLDAHGLSTISAPANLQTMTDEDCWCFAEKAQELDIVIGEAGMWDNLMTDDKNLQESRIQQVRSLLQKAEKMQCKTVVTLVGSLADVETRLVFKGVRIL